jgi:hypothetical protein
MMDLEARQIFAEELRTECERFRTENGVFESYLQRVNPPGASGPGGDEREDMNSPATRKLAGSSKKSKTKPNAAASMKVGLDTPVTRLCGPYWAAICCHRFNRVLTMRHTRVVTAGVGVRLVTWNTPAVIDGTVF